ncbi:MAG: hypothetical protein EXX96DRAFT_536234 [Benjaminiella poitrasii]|nr:MAG: hypothetical protein EXX96DRAFT_536234 [Benjaminiella poitrasii]
MNVELCKLAVILNSYIATANNTVAKALAITIRNIQVKSATNVLLIVQRKTLDHGYPNVQTPLTDNLESRRDDPNSKLFSICRPKLTFNHSPHSSALNVIYIERSRILC